MFFLVQVDKYNLPRYLIILLLAMAPLGYGGTSRLPTMIIEQDVISVRLIGRDNRPDTSGIAY